MKNKFLVKVTGVDKAGKPVERSSEVEGDQKEINDAAWTIAQKMIEEEITGINSDVSRIVEVKLPSNPSLN
jgi:hypothetical protein